MKNKARLATILILAALLLSSCNGCMGCQWNYVSIETMTETDFPHYIVTVSSQTGYSPQAYTMLRGTNPANDYDWNQVSVVQYTPKWFTYYNYRGDEGALMLKAYPKADIIMAYSGYYYIGTKHKKE